MKKRLIKLSVASAALLAAFILQPRLLLAQGSLTPPGAPAPTMKSLNQIEARTPVDATNTPGSPCCDQFAITHPGSYYLTGNINSSGLSAAIFVLTNDVTLDLNGFTMNGIGYSGCVGISVAPGYQNVVIRNGTLLNWYVGVQDQNASCSLENVGVYESSNNGFLLGNNCHLKNCDAVSNSNTGISVGNFCTVTDCRASGNLYDGIAGGSDCVISGCQANNNNNLAFPSTAGIFLEDRFTVSKCTANSNFISGFFLGSHGQIIQCVADTNANGIWVQTGCTVKDCVANGNYIGIEASGNDNVLEDNHASFNGDDGILTGNASTEDSIEHNHTTGNGNYGIYSYVPGANVVVRNTSNNNAVGNYYPTNGNTFAPVQLPAAATSPWANF